MMALLLTCQEPSHNLITVNGPLQASRAGIFLPHEHIIVDFIGADSASSRRYSSDSVMEKALPFLLELKDAGCQTFLDCTPQYVGRDVKILQQLSIASGLNIVTNTGYYGAAGQKFLPQHAFTETADQIANRWISEFRNGIDGTGIKPGFIKLGADAGSLTDANRKIMKAGAITHLQTGLTIAVHSGDGKAAQEALEIFVSEGVKPNAFVWVHAQNEKDFAVFKNMASKGVWIEFDGISSESIDQHIQMLKYMKDEKLLHQVLISQDAGWYHVGEKDGGHFHSFTTIFKEFIPKLKSDGFTESEIDVLIRKNPADAFVLRVRKN